MKTSRVVRVLLVDDTPLVLKTVQQSLARQPRLEVVGTAMGGADAIEAVRRLKPDLVVVDLNMPGMNGIETTREIKTRPDAPKVIIFSFEIASEWRRAAAEAGADDWCDKRDVTESLVGAIFRLFPGPDNGKNGA
jgi:DNA-binding NarL/FixJ family response regulator